MRVEASSSSSVNYTAPITLRMTGESLLIPGVVRHHECDARPRQRRLLAAGGRGHYTVTLLATDAELPPLSTTREVQVHPGRSVTLDFLLPAPLRAPPALRARWWARARRRWMWSLEAQALDEHLRPLSQRVTVERDTGELSPGAPALGPPSWPRPPPGGAHLRGSPGAAEAFTVNPRQGLLEPLSWATTASR